MAKENKLTDPKDKATCLVTNLNKLLVMHGLSIDKLSDRLGIPSMTIRRIVSGETADPRISTLQSIAQYFNISLDSLLGNQRLTSNDCVPYQVPILPWHELSNLLQPKLDLSTMQKWQSIMLPKDTVSSSHLFAIESKPCMYSMYPQGTIFVLNPDVSVQDGDYALIQFLEDDVFALKKVHIDHPNIYLHKIVADSSHDVIVFSNTIHAIAGVVILTLLYNHNSINIG